MSATTKPIKDKIPAQAYLLHTICFLDTGSDTAYFPHFHCSSQVVREIIIDIISIGMSKKLIYIVPLFSNMNINAIIMAISIKKQLWRDFLPGFLKDGFGGFTFEIFIKRMKLPRFV